MTDTYAHSPDVLRIAWVLRLVTEGIYERIYVSDEDVLTAFTLARDAYAGREAAINQIIKGEDLMLDDDEARRHDRMRVAGDATNRSAITPGRRQLPA